ncbi:hypothetical protein JR316_0006269 [Psilocybe cubensis]|uniref:Uncharacterized protein n=2 Tax=Psilocybe cubensis TaxID=181762 RepID=A0ACB8H241_PSICU|nr:hypothetical protein JR316_0006269 [Psilocybe cubensis]KAH9481742.1 hypothetical protein JR316_0006269 [Psilocybe cubensis]
MSTLPLSDQEARIWLRIIGLSEDELSRVNSSLEYHKERLQSITIQIDSVLDPVPGSEQFTTAFCGLPLRRRKRIGSKAKDDKPGRLPGALVKSEEATTKSIANLRSLLSPIRRLPPEILTEIFEYCLPSDKFIRASPYEAPLLLTHVCSAWRNACIANPLLWRSLEIANDCFVLDNVHCRNASSLTHMWFSRAGACPLSLSVEDDNICSERVMWIISSYGHRFQHLRINIPQPVTLQFGNANGYTSLETFEIITPYGLEDFQIAALCNSVLMTAPRLREFSWNNSAHFPPSPLRMHWGNLTRLSLNTSVHVDQCLMIMSKLERITHLTFHNICLSNPTLSNLKIHLPELTSFIICGDYNISRIFEEATTPKLNELILNLRYWPGRAVTDFLRRSRCPLQSLNLYFPPLTESDLLECLQIVQGTLKEFTVQSNPGMYSVTDDILDRLTDTGVGQVLCPHLSVIALYDCISCSPGRFAKMVRSRLQPFPTSPNSVICAQKRVVPLRVIEMYDGEAELHQLKDLRPLGLVLKMYTLDGFALEMAPEDIERLRIFKEEGLVLRVYEPSTGHFGPVE